MGLNHLLTKYQSSKSKSLNFEILNKLSSFLLFLIFFCFLFFFLSGKPFHQVRLPMALLKTVELLPLPPPQPPLSLLLQLLRPLLQLPLLALPLLLLQLLLLSLQLLLLPLLLPPLLLRPLLPPFLTTTTTTTKMVLKLLLISENAIQITHRNRFPFQFNTSTALCRCSDSFRCLGRYWNAYNQFKELDIYNSIHYVLQVNLRLDTTFIIWPARPRARNSIVKTLCKLTSVGSDELTQAIPSKAVRPCTQAVLLQKNLTEKRKEFLKK